MDNKCVRKKDAQEPIEFATKENIFQQYLNKKLTWILTILCFPFAVSLFTIQILLMITYIPKAKYSHDVEFEYSGIGIIVAGIYLIGAGITIRNLYKPSYCRIWLTLICYIISFGMSIGLIVFVNVEAMYLVRYGSHTYSPNQDIYELPYCNCVDDAGNILRNGTDPNWDCNIIPPTCDTVDQVMADSNWRKSLLSIMIVAASFQCIWALILCMMSCSALICVSDTFDELTVPGEESGINTSRGNAYAMWFPNKAISTIGWIQLGVALLSMLLAMCNRTGAGWHLFQFCAVGSYVVLNLMSRTEPALTYYRLSGLGVLHFLSFGAMISCVLVLGESMLYPFAGIEIILSGIIIIVAFRPIFKVSTLVTEARG